MGTLFVYAIQSGICLTVFFVFYKFLLSRETFHRLNRAALLGILMFSLALPLFNFSTAAEAQSIEIPLEFILAAQNNAVLPEPQLPPVQPETAKITVMHFLLIVYIFVSIFFALRGIFSIIQIHSLIRKGKKQRIGNSITLVLHTGNIAPFSWFRHIVISEKDFAQNGDVIIEHEKAHIAKHHSFDTLLCEACSILQWFNPAAWMFKRELRNIHEYQADEAVISKNINKKEYQLLIIQKTVGNQMFAMANNFFHKNKLKKRIKMMSKQKSSPYSRLKYLYVLPLLAVVATAFANSHVQDEMNRISAVSISDFASDNDSSDTVSIHIYTEEDEAPVYILNGELVGDIDSINENIIENITVIKDKTDNDKRKNTIIVTTDRSSGEKSGKTLIKSAGNGHIIIIKDGDTIQNSKLNRQGKSYAYAYSTGSSDSTFYYITMNIDSFKNMNTVFTNHADSLKKYKFHFHGSNTNFDSVWTSGISQFNLDSIKNIAKMVKQKNYNFNIFSFDSTKNYNRNKLNADSIQRRNMNAVNYISKPLIIVDGKEYNLDTLPKAEQVSSVSVLKDDAAIKQYGEKARNGVIVIETKKQSK